MACNCLATINDELKEQGLRLKAGFVIVGNRPSTFPLIETAFLVPKRGKKAPAMFPTYCPFCGVRYAPDASDQAQESNHG